MNINEGLKEVAALKGKMSELSAKIERQKVIKEQCSSTGFTVALKQPSSIDSLLKDLLIIFKDIEGLKKRITEANLKSGALTLIHELNYIKSSITTLRPLSEAEEEVVDVSEYSQNPIITKRKINYNLEDVNNALKEYEIALKEKLAALDRINYETQI